MAGLFWISLYKLIDLCFVCMIACYILYWWMDVNICILIIIIITSIVHNLCKVTGTV